MKSLKTQLRQQAYRSRKHLSDNDIEYRIRKAVSNDALLMTYGNSIYKQLKNEFTKKHN